MTSDAVPAESLPPADVPEPDSRRAVALVVGVVATVAFVVMRIVVAAGGREPLPMDVWWHDLMVSTETEPGIFLAWVPSHIGSTVGMIIIGIVIIALFLLRRRKWDAANVAVAMVIVVAIGAPLAFVIARVRPDNSLAETVPTSFPSGHTAVATTVAITLALLLRRWYVWVIGIVWVVWMMWARTYLYAHWLSDVIAGMLEGVAVATLVWCVFEAVRDRRAAKHVAERAA